MDLLASSWHKYRWANKHAEAVYRTLQGIFDEKRHPLTFKVEMEDRGPNITVTGRVTRIPIVDEPCGLTLGDAIQNYRAALDHLTWDLVRIGGKRLTDNQRKQVQFPIYKTGVEFDSNRNRRLPGVPKDHWAICRRYQPYRSGEGPKAIRWLHRLSNMDKHRVLIPAVVGVNGINIRVETNLPLVGYRPLLTARQVLKVNTPVMQVDCAVTPAARECRVRMHGYLELYPSLGYETRLLDVLRLIDKTVFGILQKFDEIL